MPPTLSTQTELLIRHVNGLYPTDITPELIEKVLAWIRDLPPDGRPQQLLDVVTKKFKISGAELDLRLKRKTRQDFDDLVPTTGWLHDYIQYTRNTEPPTVFHFFAGMSAIGAQLARNVFFDMGAYQIFANLCTVIVAPSGRCKKTSACNLAVGLYRAVGGNVLADKVTPEALITAFQDRSSATGLIYAPELAVFLGKQKYNEGMVPLLTALFDCPKEWSSATIMRGESHLKNVALSFLVCSTMDWLSSAIPRDAFGGGFMSRLLFVVQNDTPRVFPHPPQMDQALQHSLKARLFSYGRIRGRFEITEEADKWYVEWYINRRQTIAAEKQFAGYAERKPDHLHRIAMILAIAELQDEKHEGLKLTLPRMKQALAILDWVESYLPTAFSEMSQTGMGEESSRLLKQLKEKGGMISNNEWLRMNVHRMNKIQFRQAVDTLREAKLVDYDGVKRVYCLTPEGFAK
jgi:hypothetical protein